MIHSPNTWHYTRMDPGMSLRLYTGLNRIALADWFSDDGGWARPVPLSIADSRRYRGGRWLPIDLYQGCGVTPSFFRRKSKRRIRNEFRTVVKNSSEVIEELILHRILGGGYRLARKNRIRLRQQVQDYPSQ